jgi:hypothetical protein
MVQRQPVLGEQWVLTGREPLLREVVESVTAGGGVVLCGPSGVGKTRLAREALKRLKGAGWRAEWIAATQAASAIPLGAMSHLLPRDCHTLPAVLHGMADRWAGGATVVAVDDAHLLDAASATVVHHLSLHTGVPVVVTMRYGERCLDAVTALWKEGLARRIEVPAVTGEAVGELLDQTFGESLDGAGRRWLARVSEGNPLLLREILRAGLDTRVLRSRNGLWRWEGPVRPTTRLVEVVTAWLGSVSRAVARVVELAACCPGRAAAGVVAGTALRRRVRGGGGVGGAAACRGLGAAGPGAARASALQRGDQIGHAPSQGRDARR